MKLKCNLTHKWICIPLLYGKGLFYCTGGTGGDEGVAGELDVERGDNGVGREEKEEVEKKKEGGG